ncbi:UDP-glucose dehydrogenase [Labilithrix luteola]|uniref:UDP-glucose 6-dehydrogenase n=1 Tax=Labilithrix luteola TaxID=1391654 RepID=A0A0K1QBF8_9BACT|nr:UDP-glucose/GDP-mannose dehydrogenase family protein [Labilithrix luteola]AKV02735.1 UDP-glucose dehydrogenase [Labilithrix luteola]
MRLVVFGAGYVGLVTGTGLSDLGHEVLLYDIDPDRIAKLNDGRVPIYEPGLGDLIHRNQRGGRLHFATEIPASFADADAYFIAVGTPPGPDGAADLSAVMAVADTIAKVATRKAVVVVKSTVPVGTCDAVQARLAGAKVSLEVVSNPEFLKEGDAVSDFFKPDRVVVGARSDEARQMLRELYAPLQLSGERLVMTDPRSSELIKYASNTMLAIRISFMNELSRLCHATGADIHAVRLGVGTDSRIGKKFLYAGPGYGGSCFPKDVQALAALGRENGVQLKVAEAAHQANEDQAVFLAQLVDKALEGVMGKQITLWGLAFKPETDDVRESPAVKLASALIERGATVIGHDPEAGPNFTKVFGSKVAVKERDYDALDGSHALILLTEWRSYRAPNFAEIKRRLKASADGMPPVLVDARNIWRPSEVQRAGLRYQGIGVSLHRAADRPSQVLV